MPSILNLNAFKNAVNQLGDEPAVVEARDEPLEDIQPEEEEDFPLRPVEEQAPAEEESELPEWLQDDDVLADDLLDAEILPQTDDTPNGTLPDNIVLPEEATVPQDIHQMLDTGFGGLESKNLGSNVLGEERLSALISGAEKEQPQTTVEEDNEVVPEEETPLAASLQGGDTLNNVTILAQALQQHRSIDLFNISEDEATDVIDNSQYDELEFNISQENARDFLLQLGTYPIPLKIAIEEEIGENELSEEAVETLVEMVSAGAHPRQVANYFFSQTGKRIVLPKGQRYHAVDQAKVNTRFHRQFIMLGFPLLRRALTGILLIAVLFWLPFYYIYRPIQSYLYYQKGHNKIYQDQFNDAEKYFNLATNGWPILGNQFFVRGWPMKNWLLSYGQAYAQRKDYIEAGFKMRETIRHYPDFRIAWFDYINLLSNEMGEFAEAEKSIQQYYNQFGRDYDSLILRGQNYLNWGEVNPHYYEEARQVFATTYSLENRDDLPLLYLLDYYIRTAAYNPNKEQLQKLASFFMNTDVDSLEVPPLLLARVLGKTANYYLDKGNIEVAKLLLKRALEASDNSTEVYLVYARYFRLTASKEKEQDALDSALFFLNYRDDRNTTPNLVQKLLVTQQRARFITENSKPLEASFLFNNLLVQLDEVQRRHLSLKQSNIAEVFSLTGNFYYKNTPESLNALAYYDKAIGLGLVDPHINYRYGYLLYQRDDYKQAVEQFLQSQMILGNNNKIKYALGNSLLQTGSYNSAQGILEQAYTSLQEELRISFLTDPQHSQEARDRLFMLVRLANDLGVSYYREALQSPNIRNQQTSLAYFIQGMGYLDILSRESTVQLKLPPELLFRPRLLDRKIIQTLEQSISAQGLVPGSLPDSNFKQILQSRAGLSSLRADIKSYKIDIQEPTGLQETMDY